MNILRASFVPLFFSTLLVSAEEEKLEFLNANRYTRQGPADTMVEIGTLEVATKEFEVLSTGVYTNISLRTSDSVLDAINGKFVAATVTVDAFRQIKGDAFLSHFVISPETYATGVVLTYLVDFAGSGGPATTSAQISMSKRKEKEGKTLKAIIKLDQPAADDFLIRYKTKGSAKEKKDYRIKARKGGILVKKGSKKAVVRISLLDDKRKEKTEKAVITLQTGENYQIGRSKTVVFRIRDND